MPVVGRNAAANATKNGGGSRKLRPRSAPNGAAKPRRATPTRCTNSHLGDITTNGPSMIQLARRARAPAIRRGRGRRGSTSPRELKPLKPWRPRVPQLPRRWRTFNRAAVSAAQSRIAVERSPRSRSTGCCYRQPAASEDALSDVHRTTARSPRGCGWS